LNKTPKENFLLSKIKVKISCTDQYPN